MSEENDKIATVKQADVVAESENKQSQQSVQTQAKGGQNVASRPARPNQVVRPQAQTKSEEPTQSVKPVKTVKNIRLKLIPLALRKSMLTGKTYRVGNHVFFQKNGEWDTQRDPKKENVLQLPIALADKLLAKGDFEEVE